MNTSFSLKLPTLQLAIDSTSLGAYKTCPRLYYQSIVLGWQSKRESVHLQFGLLFHSCVERYHHKKAAGQSHDDALDFVFDWLLRETWNKTLNRPWDTSLLQDGQYKNRFTLLRSVVGYLDKYGEHDALQTVILENGKPAVELSFSFDSGFTSNSTGEPFLLCGHMDRMAILNGDPYILDPKTTKSELNARYWSSHNPSNQFGIYLLAGQITYKQPVKGLLVDGIQVQVGDTKYDRHLITKDKFQLEEFHKSTGIWLRQMEDSAADAEFLINDKQDASLAYPMNETSCTKYNGCDFQSVCSRSPSARKLKLETDFKRRIWDPLKKRGDV